MRARCLWQLEDIREARDEVREGQQDAGRDEHVARHSASQEIGARGWCLGAPGMIDTKIPAKIHHKSAVIGFKMQ